MPLLKEKYKINRKSLIKWSVLFLIPAIAIVMFLLFSGNRDFANSAVANFSRPVRDFLGTLCSYVPFSVMELMYVVLICFSIIFIIRTVFLIIHGPHRLKIFLTRISVMTLIVIYIVTGYLWLWGIDYRADSFADKTGFSSDGISTDELYTVTKYFVLSAAALANSVERDADGHFIQDPDTYFQRSVHVFDVLAQEFPCLDCASRIPKKMIFSYIMSITGFTGVYFPFTGESNINIEAPAAFIPCTIAHELAHQRGVYSEQECNFLGVTACVTSGEAVYTYSGYLSGSLYLMNALYRADYDSWRELSQYITGNYRVDWADNNEYWASMESAVTNVSETVYDNYLKANGQDIGIQSYGACVDLLVEYFINKI